MKEKDIQSEVLRVLGSQPHIRVFRNTVGGAWAGKAVLTEGRSVIIKDARWQAFGLQPGSGDLIGWRTTTVTPDMVGQKLAVFLSVEIKGPGGRVQPNQSNWISRVTEAGGIAVVVRSPEEARNLI